MEGRCLLQPAGVSDTKQLPTASRAQGASRANLHNKKLAKKCPMSRLPKAPSKPCCCPGSALLFGGAAHWVLLLSLRGGSGQSWFSHLYSHSEAKSRSVLLHSHQVSGQTTVCPLDGLISLLPASLSNSLSSWAMWYSSSCHRSCVPTSSLVWTLSLDCRTQDNKSKELCWCWRPFSWCNQQDFLAASSQAPQP